MIFSYLGSNLSCVKYFKIAAILKSWQMLLPEVEYTSMIATRISDILSFWRTLQLKCWWRYGNFRIWLTLWPDDVINDVMKMDLYKYSNNPMISIYKKFNDDIFVVFFSYHEKCSYFIYKGMYLLIFQNLLIGRHFEVATNFFTNIVTNRYRHTYKQASTHGENIIT